MKCIIQEYMDGLMVPRSLGCCSPLLKRFFRFEALGHLVAEKWVLAL